MSQPIPTLTWERAYWSRGLASVAGVDEAGRGAWAGPVVAGAVVLPQVRRSKCWWTHPALRDLARARDSKLLSPAQREALFEPICRAARTWATGLATRLEIDQLGIVCATHLAMRRAVAALTAAPDALLVDAMRLPEWSSPQCAIIHGDQLSLSIACASIVAKVTRDRLMVELDGEVGGYEFARHKGYGTAAHRAALERLGASSAHRLTFAPVRDRLTRGEK